jgi:hypothetical protein
VHRQAPRLRSFMAGEGIAVVVRTGALAFHGLRCGGRCVSGLWE